MATRPVGTVYPKARGRQVKVLNDVIVDIINAVVQCYFCDKDEVFPESPLEQYGYVWKKIEGYAGKVIKFHRY